MNYFFSKFIPYSSQVKFRNFILLKKLIADHTGYIDEQPTSNIGYRRDQAILIKREKKEIDFKISKYLK